MGKLKFEVTCWLWPFSATGARQPRQMQAHRVLNSDTGTVTLNCTLPCDCPTSGGEDVGSMSVMIGM